MKKLILVVEDEYGISEMLRMILEADNYRVALASNGQLALELLKGEIPALILSDFMMPVLNGGELGVAVRQTAALAQVPFVFMSATTEDTVHQAFGDYDAFLTKPFDVDALLAVVDRLVTNGRVPLPTEEEVSASVRALLRGMQLPPG